MSCFSRPLLLLALATLMCTGASAADPMPSEVMAAMRESGVPLKSFGFYARPVERTERSDRMDDGLAAKPLASLNAEQTFWLASTTKVVTSLAALDLLGPTHLWPLRAHATGPVVNGQLRGDLVIAGNRHPITADEMRLWFKQMRAEGLQSISGQLVLQGVLLLPESSAEDGEDLAAATTEPTGAGPRSDAARAYNEGSMVLSIEPGQGDRAKIVLTPQPPDVVIVNDVLMGGPCDAWARWANPGDNFGPKPHLWVRGRWDASCPKEYVAYVRPLPGMARAANVVLPALGVASAPLSVSSVGRAVAGLWAETGGVLRGRVIEAGHRPDEAPVSNPTTKSAWRSEFSIPLSQVVREINKTSDNEAARSLLLSLSADGVPPGQARQDAKNRIHEWLRGQGLVDGDIRVDLGSGQSREERGRPRAMVQLLCNAWRTKGAQAFVDSLPIAGVDGTLVNRMRDGLAKGQAFLKTGTLSDTRALAGYVRGRSGTVYAVTAIVNHPDAARARPALDAFISWVVKHG
jgi:D-alanyl-D-alanine carboxypeptidase/D-alanyl-D-alanine-endopeptidase (penicillin-binding protein 4)